MQPNDPTNPQQPQQPAEQPVQPSPQPQQPVQPVQQQPVQSAVYQDAPAQPAQSATTGSEYQSNPFLVTVSGLITLLKVNPIPSLLLVVYVVVMLIAVIIVTLIFTLILPLLALLVGAIGIIGVIALAGGATIALADRSIKNEKVETGALFKDASRKLLPLIAASVLTGIAVLIGLILLIIPGLFLGARLSLTYFAIMHEDLGAIAAMKRSMELTKGHAWEMLGAVFAGMLMTGNGGGLLSIPATIAPLSGRYDQLLSLKASGQPKPKTHWANYVLPIVAVLLTVAYFSFVAIAAKSDIDKGRNTDQNLTYPSNYTDSGYDTFAQ